MLFDFDKNTGILSNVKGLKGLTSLPTGTRNNIWSVEFSPDNRLLYATNYSSVTAPQNYSLYQYDITVTNPQTTLNSIFSSTTSSGILSSMWTGSDNKIYLAHVGATNISVINNPNIYGAGCSFVLAGVSLSGRTCQYGLQNIVPLNLPIIDASIANFTANTSTCLSVSFTNLVTPPYTDVCSFLYNNDTLMYTWNFGDGNTSTLYSPIHVYATGGTYTVSLVVTRPFMCTSDTLTQSITVSIPPSVTLSPVTATICIGSNTTLIASGASTYVWSPATGLSGTTGTTVIANPVVTSTYSVIGSNGSCSDTTIITVTVVPAIATIQTINLCSGISYTLPSGTSVSVAGTYSDTLTTFGGCDSIITTNISVTPAIASSQSVSICAGNSYTLPGGSIVSIAGTYSDTLIAFGGCDSVITTNLTINLSPTVSVSPASPTICIGSSTTLTAGGASTFVWNPAIGLSATTGSSVTANPILTTTYTVIGTTAGCTNTSTVTVTVNSLPVINITGSTSICSGSSTTLTATGGGTYLWSTSGTLNSIIVNPTSTTSYTVIVTGTNFCVDSLIQIVTVNVLPIANAGIDQAICSGNSATLIASGGSTYTWSNGATAPTISVSPILTTQYIMTASNGTCTDTDTVNVIVNPSPIASISPIGITITQGTTTILTATGGGTYQWMTGATTPSINVSPTQTTQYCVTVTNSANCLDTACASVTVDIQCGELFVPNGFSPNNDGSNDLLEVKIKPSCVTSFSILIFDRWGEKVFESTDIEYSWDGNYKGKPLDNAVFVYYLNITLINSKDNIVQKGNVSIIK